MSGEAGMTKREVGRGEERWTDLPAGRIPMCCWPSSTKLPIGWPSGLYAAPWLTEGSRRKPDCSQNVDMKKGGGKKKRKHTRQSAIVPAPAQTYCKTLCSCLRTALTDVWHANTHTVGPHACMQADTHTHILVCAHTHAQAVSFKTTLTGDTLFSNREKKACSLTG